MCVLFALLYLFVCKCFYTSFSIYHVFTGKVHLDTLKKADEDDPLTQKLKLGLQTAMDEVEEVFHNSPDDTDREFNRNAAVSNISLNRVLCYKSYNVQSIMTAKKDT